MIASMRSWLSSQLVTSSNPSPPSHAPANSRDISVHYSFDYAQQHRTRCSPVQFTSHCVEVCSLRRKLLGNSQASGLPLRASGPTPPSVRWTSSRVRARRRFSSTLTVAVVNAPSATLPSFPLHITPLNSFTLHLPLLYTHS